MKTILSVQIQGQALEEIFDWTLCHTNWFQRLNFNQIGGLQKKIEPYKPLQGRWHSHGCLSEFVLHFKQLPIQLNGKQSDIGMLCKD